MNAPLEPCFNVWIFMEPGTGVVMQMSAKPYVLAGSDDERLDVLRRLSATDFWSAPRLPVPERYVLFGPDGQRLQGALSVADVAESDLVMDAIDAVGRMPVQISMEGGEPRGVFLPVPAAPLVVTTFVEERHDGTLVPVLKGRGGM